MFTMNPRRPPLSHQDAANSTIVATSVHKQQPLLARRIGRSLALVGFALAATAASAQEIPCDEPPSDLREYSAGANVTWGDPTVLVPAPNLYAWEKATVSVTEAVNINREIYEERKCNWFGINCWYEKRVRNNPVTANQLPLTYFATPSRKTFDARDSTDRKDVGAVVDSPLSDDYVAYWREMSVTDSRVLRGVVGFGNTSINRTSCEGEPRVCSIGAYTVKFKIDSGPRAYRLVSELSQQRFSYEALMSPDILNANLRQSNVRVRACLAKALYEQAITFHGPGSNSTAAERQKILQEALKLNPTDTAVKTALGSTFLETGQFDEARKQTTDVISDLEKKRMSRTADAATYDELARNYATLAETSWRETAGNSTSAATEAAGALRLSIERLEERLRDHPLERGAVDARGQLVDNAIRLAQVLARLGTTQDMTEAVSVIAKARDELPRRLSNIIAVESDAVAGTVAFSRADGPLLSDRAWRLEVSTLAVPDDTALTPFGVDAVRMVPTQAAGPAHAAVYRLGGGAPHVQSLQALLSSGRARNLATTRNSCLHQAAALDAEQAIAVVWDSDDKTNRLTTFANYGSKVAGQLGAFAIARGDARRVATLAWEDGGLLEGQKGWHLTDARTDLGDPRALTIIEGSKEDVPVLRASPSGQFYAVGLKSQDSTRAAWALVDAKDAAKRVNIKCVGPNDTPLRIDDIAFIEEAASGGIAMVGIGPQCVAHFSKIDGNAEIVLTNPMDGDIGRPQAAAALAGRMTSFAWASKEGEPVGVMSWEPNPKGHPAANSYKLHVLRWRFAASEQSPTQRALYQAGLAPWAAPINAPVCEGAARGAFDTHERFRITDLTIAADPPRNGVVLERPVVKAVVAGIYGTIALREGQLSDNAAPKPSALIVSAGSGTVEPIAMSQPSSALPRPDQSKRLVTSAPCNIGNFRDLQVGAGARVYALRRSNLAIVRIRKEGRESCEGPSLPLAQKDAVRRTYTAPTANGLLQVLDLAADNEVLRLTLAEVPPDAERQRELQPEIIAPAACDLKAGIKPGTCDAADLIAALSEGAARVLALLRDTTTDPGRDQQEPRRTELGEAVERATHLVFIGLATGGWRDIAVVPLPLVGQPVTWSFRIPSDAEALAMLDDGKRPLLITRVTNAAKLMAFDASGSVQGEVEVEDDFLDPNRSRRLVARDRIVLVAQGAAGAAARLRVLSVESGQLMALACADCALQTDAAVHALFRQLRIGPWLNPEGRLERFITDWQLRNLIVAKLGDDLSWKGWVRVSLDGAKGRELTAAGAGAPILLDDRYAVIAPQPGTVEFWGTKP